MKYYKIYLNDKIFWVIFFGVVTSSISVWVWTPLPSQKYHDITTKSTETFAVFYGKFLFSYRQ